MVELKEVWIVIINMKYLFKNKVSRSKLEKNKRRLVGRDAMAISPEKEQLLLLSICRNSLKVWPDIGKDWYVSGQKGSQ